MELKKFSQVMDEAMESYEERARVEQEIFIQDGQIVMTCDGISYEIPLDECQSVTGAMKWLHHMSEKSWVTEARLWRIAECMVEHESGKKASW